MSSIANIGLRGLEFVFGVLVLGLAGHLVHTQSYGSAPSETSFDVFVGIWILLCAFIGFASGFVGILSGIVMLALDGLGVLFTFAAGVALAAKLGVHSCSCSLSNQSCPYLVNNHIINGGYTYTGGKQQVNLDTDRVGRCRQAQAATAFTWFAFACLVGTAFLSFMSWRRGGVK